MSDFDVSTISIDGRTTALGSAGPFTLIIDRAAEAGGGGQGFNGGQLLNMAVAGCISNDLFREAARKGITLHRVRVDVTSDYKGSPAVSTPISYTVEIEGDASEDALRELMSHVDESAEIPNSIRNGTAVTLGLASITSTNT